MTSIPVDFDSNEEFRSVFTASVSFVAVTKAREVIESFPPTSENYEKAIEALKNRFGREELLIEFYDHELLALVMQNATERRGLTSEKYEAILFPLVESCITEELMRVWLRNPTQLSAENELTADYGEGPPEIELLIEAEFCGQLFPGLIYKLECGLIAYETYLGWVLMDRTSNNIKRIKEPSEKTPREEEVMKFFNDTLSTDFDSRYMVRLPWNDNSSLPNNKNIAEKRLFSTTSKLISSGKYSDYNSVLES
ncbi:integrase catalytic domain-containing protein [Trichonephila clavipes]|nr:integrase catalytic domain-containing protein [Trichonephila clavipes]